MRDDKGIYYHAEPANPAVRVYVREGPAGIEFRMWAREHPEVWERHGWVPYEAIQAAASLYRAERSPNADPLKLYDLKVAKALLAEDEA